MKKEIEGNRTVWTVEDKELLLIVLVMMLLCAVLYDAAFFYERHLMEEARQEMIRFEGNPTSKEVKNVH